MRPELALKLGGSDQLDSIDRRFCSLLESAGRDYKQGYQFIVDFAKKVVDAWHVSEVRENYYPFHRDRLEHHVKSIAKTLSL